MTKPPVTFPDPERIVIDFYKAAFAPRSESYKPATITSAFPSSALTTSTHLQVELEVGNADDYPITERAQVRVTAYAAPGHRDDVKSLASLAQGLLYAWAGNASAAGAFIRIGRSDVVTDPDTKNLMVWFVASVSLKATVLAS